MNTRSELHLNTKTRAAAGAQLRKNGVAIEKPPLPLLAESAVTTPVAQDWLRQLIAETAYYRAERRGFLPGHELDDWLAAEAEVTDYID